MIRKLINWLCWTLVKTFPSRYHIVDIDGDPYLLRFYIKRNGRLPGVYLHHFYRGDADRDLHNHPWEISGSLILTGGYVEERLVARRDGLEARHNRKSIRTHKFEINPHGIVGIVEVTPGSINIIRANDFHRVDLLDGPAWSLFVSGKKVQDWGFWERDTGTFIPHREYFGCERSSSRRRMVK